MATYKITLECETVLSDKFNACGVIVTGTK